MPNEQMLRKQPTIVLKMYEGENPRYQDRDALLRELEPTVLFNAEAAATVAWKFLGRLYFGTTTMTITKCIYVASFPWPSHRWLSKVKSIPTR